MIAKKSVKILTIISGMIIVLLAIIFLFPNLKEKFLYVSKGISEQIRQTTDVFNSVEACYSSDGINITKKKAVVHLFGMQGGIELQDGTILLTGLDFVDLNGIIDEQTGHSIKGVGFYQSQNGWNFSKFKPTITGLSRTITAWGDPVIIQLPEGGYRMYFTERIANTPANLVSAYSQDGYNYTFEDQVTGEQGINLDAVDFTAFYEKNAKKYYIYTRAEKPNEAWVLESEDGRYFSKRYKISIPFSLQFSVIEEGDHYIAYGGHIPADNKEINTNLRYPVRAISQDGLHWQREELQPDGPWTGDKLYCGVSAVLKLPDGYYFY